MTEGTALCKLNIGAGDLVIPGYIAIDRKQGNEAYPLPEWIEPYSIDEIRASHILEHFNFSDSLKALEDWRRRMKQGAVIKISVPDFNKVMEYQRKGGKQWRFLLMGGQLNKDDYHFSVWDEESLTMVLEKCGFTDIRPWELGENDTDTARHSTSLNLMATNNPPVVGEIPDGEITQHKDVKIMGIIALPRIGWTDHWGSVQEALGPLHIPVRKFTTCFWHQGMQNCLEWCVEQDLDWILALDYDTVFTRQHVELLLQIFAAHPECDALGPLQIKRGDITPLCTIQGKQGDQIITGDLTEVDTIHFGLTLIRVDAIRDMPKPWLLSVPDPDGSYGPDRRDADIYFWDQFKRHGKRVFMTPKVRVGHLQVMVSEFSETDDGQLIPAHHFITDWKGQPV